MTAAKKKPAKKQAAKPKTKAKEKQPANATEGFMPAILCAHTKLVPIESLKRHPRNPNTHPDSQIKLLAHISTMQNIIPCGRLGSYQYLDMDKCILNVMDAVERAGL